MEEIKNEKTDERAILVGFCDTGSGENITETENSVQELGLLAKTAGAKVVGTIVQQKHKIDSRTYIGSGKLDEIVSALDTLDANLIIFDDELSGSQIRNVEEIAGCKIIDRTLLILDIFSQRAKSREGKLQVELAQQRYRYSRLVGMGKSLSRLAGGIGTRGPGESKLESDRRHLSRRIDYLKREIEKVGNRRERARRKRHDSEIITIAVAGYTNAGKSTLINRLCESDLYTEDKLFATLDPTARSVVLPDGYEAVLVDTVGFIRKLPHHLIEAFKSTLEELGDADIIMHVIDSSDTDMESHVHTAENLMEQLECASKPRITVLNKADISAHIELKEKDAQVSFNGKDGSVVRVSALTGKGLDILKEEISRKISNLKTNMEVLIPYDKASLLDRARKNGKVVNVEYLEEGIRARISLSPSKTGLFEKYIV